MDEIARRLEDRQERPGDAYLIQKPGIRGVVPFLHTRVERLERVNERSELVNERHSQKKEQQNDHDEDQDVGCQNRQEVRHEPAEDLHQREKNIGDGSRYQQ